jgi:hypothetical protein
MVTERESATQSSIVASERVELKGLYAQMLGVWYPRNYIVAAIDPTQGPAAVNADAARRVLSQPRSDRRRNDEPGVLRGG